VVRGGGLAGRLYEDGGGSETRKEEKRLFEFKSKTSSRRSENFEQSDTGGGEKGKGQNQRKERSKGGEDKLAFH